MIEKLRKNVEKTICYFRSKTRKVYFGLLSILSISIGSVIPSFAGSPDPTTTLTNVKNLFMGVLAIVGVIVVGKNVFDFASAMQERDSQGMKQAGLGIGGGVLMAGIGAVMTFIGLS